MKLSGKSEPAGTILNIDCRFPPLDDSELWNDLTSVFCPHLSVEMMLICTLDDSFLLYQSVDLKP